MKGAHLREPPRLEIGLRTLHRKTARVLEVVRAERVPVYVVDERTRDRIPLAVICPPDEESPR